MLKTICAVLKKLDAVELATLRKAVARDYYFQVCAAVLDAVAAAVACPGPSRWPAAFLLHIFTVQRRQPSPPPL